MFTDATSYFVHARSIHLVPIWILFENVMSMHRMRAALTGLLETMYVDEWVVTEKVGDHVKDKLEVPLLTPVKPTECVERYVSRKRSSKLYALRSVDYHYVAADCSGENVCLTLLLCVC